MAIPVGGGGTGNAGYIPLIDFLKSKLGGYFVPRGDDQSIEDNTYENLVRLRALFENGGWDTSDIEQVHQKDYLLKSDQGTVHELVFGTDSGRLSSAVNALFGQPGRININLGGSDMPDGGDARDAVAQAWSSMSGLGDPSDVMSQPPPSTTAQYIEGGVADTPRPSQQQTVTSPPMSERNFSPQDAAPGTGGSGGSGTTGGGGTWSEQDDSLAEPGTGRQIPGGEQLWHVGGKVYLVYENPDHPGLYMYWHVESPDRLQAIYGDSTPAFDREMSDAEFKKLSPWRGGLAAELENTSEDPWVQFNSDFKEAAKLRPWLNDPTMQAVMMGAYLEGRAPTQDELSQTDWWNDHTASERAWLEQSVTLGREELARRREDQSSKVAEALRQAGVSNAPSDLVNYIAEQSLTGRWSEQYLTEQIRKLADPFAPGDLDDGVRDLLDGVDLDTTRKFEDQVRGLMEEWLGPEMGRFKDADVAKWAGRLRNDPDASVELEDALRQQRLALFPNYNENLTYRQIVTPVENLAAQVWGRPVQDSAFLVDLANTMDYSEMSKRLRTKGRKEGVRKVWQDMLGAAGSTPVGERVVRSAI